MLMKTLTITIPDRALKVVGDAMIDGLGQLIEVEPISEMTLEEYEEVCRQIAEQTGSDFEYRMLRVHDSEDYDPNALIDDPNFKPKLRVIDKGEDK